MDIYVVQPGDDIYSIADKYGVTVSKLIQDNGLENPNNLVIGQTIVITYPETTHTVQKGDTLNDIAAAYGVTPMQLLRNNPYLSGRRYIYPGEIITISYKTERDIVTNGFTYPYIKRDTLLKTLPDLTYLTVFNYRVNEEGEIAAYYDDLDIVQTSLNYGVIPLMMLTNLSQQGEPDIQTVYNILLNEAVQDRIIENVLSNLKTKGYMGVNITFLYLNKSNQNLYNNYIKRVADRLHKEGFLAFVTVSLDIKEENNEIIFEKIDFTNMGQTADGLIFMKLIWGTNNGPPSPVSSINYLRAYTDYIVTMTPPDKIVLGKPLVAYDWLLPYIPGTTVANSLTTAAALQLANDTGERIQFDEISQTPYFYYNRINLGTPAQHIVWSIDARSIDALDKIITDYGLAGSGVWNIMVYSPQLWLVLVSQFNIIKLIPENTDVII